MPTWLLRWISDMSFALGFDGLCEWAMEELRDRGELEVHEIEALDARPRKPKPPGKGPSALLLAIALLGAPALCATAPADAQCPCPPKKARKAVAKPHPRPTPSPSPTPSPEPIPWVVEPPDNEQRMVERMAVPVLEPTPAPTPEPSPTPKPQGMKATVLAGGLVSFGSGASGGTMTPLAHVGINGPIPLAGIQPNHFPRVLVSADFTALPGDTASFPSLDTFKALEFEAAIAQKIAPEMRSGAQRITASLYAAAGFATRLPGDTEPRDQTPRYGVIGFRLDEWTSGSFLAVGIAADQRLDGLYQPAVLIRGGVLLKELGSGSLQGGRAMLIGDAILGLGYSYPVGNAPVRRDVIRAGIAIGR